MANRKVVDLPELITMSNDDELYIVDISDLTESSEGTSKKIKASNFVPSGGELIANKQNSLTSDGTGVKYPTVDAVNNLDTNLVHKIGNETIDGDKTFNDALGTNSDLTIYGADLVFDAGANTLAVGTGILTANRTVNFKDESGTVALISDIVGGTIDPTPTDGSTNAVQSNGVFDALALKISGTGTTNYLSKFTSAGVLGDSKVLDDGTTLKVAEYFEVNPIDRTVNNIGVFRDLLRNNAITYLKYQTQHWNGSSMSINTRAYMIGENAGGNNKGENIGLISGFQSGANNSGSYIGLISGSYAGENNTGSNIGLIAGHLAGRYNTGGGIGLISGSNAGQYNISINIGLISGVDAGQYNTGQLLGFVSGYRAGQNNTGALIGAIGGYEAGQNNLGSNIGLIFGQEAGKYNTESNIGLFSGSNAGQYNTGSNIGAFAGYYAGRYNQGNNNNVIGSFSFSNFYDNVSGLKNFDATAIDIATDYITIPSHGFGATGKWTNLKFTQGTSAITGLSNNTIYQVYIVDANTIQTYRQVATAANAQAVYRGTNITAAGTGTGHSFTPQYIYSNVNIFGSEIQPTKSNQTIIGTPATTEFIAYGTHLIGTTTDNGVDKLQVAGTISASPATLSNQVVVKSQLSTQIEVGSSSNVLEAWMDNEVIFTASCTITVPATLPTNFNFNWLTLAGVTVTWAITSPHTWLFGTPGNATEKIYGRMVKRNSTNSIIML